MSGESTFFLVMLVVGALEFVFAPQVGRWSTDWQKAMHPFCLVFPESWNTVLARAAGAAMVAGASADLLGAEPEIIATILISTLLGVFVIYGVLAYREAGEE